MSASDTGKNYTYIYIYLPLSTLILLINIDTVSLYNTYRLQNKEKERSKVQKFLIHPYSTDNSTPYRHLLPELDFPSSLSKEMKIYECFLKCSLTQLCSIQQFKVHHYIIVFQTSLTSSFGLGGGFGGNRQESGLMRHFCRINIIETEGHDLLNFMFFIISLFLQDFSLVRDHQGSVHYKPQSKKLWQLRRQN